MRKTFLELKAGDTVYLVDKTKIRGLCISEATVEKDLAQNEQIPDWWDLYISAYGTLPVRLVESYLDKTAYGHIFTSLEEAQEHYLSKVDEQIDNYDKLIAITIKSLNHLSEVKLKMTNTKRLILEPKENEDVQ